jgi:hypothetical protein
MLWRTGLCSKVVPFGQDRSGVGYSPPHTRPAQAPHPRNASRPTPTPNSPSTTPTSRPYRHIWAGEILLHGGYSACRVGYTKRPPIHDAQSCTSAPPRRQEHSMTIRPTLRRVLILLALLALLALPSAGAVAGNADNPFHGRWLRVDATGDGSTDSIVIGGGNNRARYQENALTACASLTGAPSRGFASGFGTIDGDTLTFEATLYCVVPGEGLVPSESLSDPSTFRFTYEEGLDAILFEGLCHHRPNQPACD